MGYVLLIEASSKVILKTEELALAGLKTLSERL